MCIGCHYIFNAPSLKIEDIIIEKVDYFNFLGLTVDSHIN